MALEVLPLKPQDRDAVIGLFERYPYKAYQKRVQGLDAGRLAPLLWTSLERQIGKPRMGAWVAWRAAPREAVALASVSPHPWHGEIFGRAMGRIDHFVNYIEPDTAGPPLIEAVLARTRAAGIAHLAARVDGEDWPNIHLMEGHGFRCVELSEKMVRALAQPPPHEGVEGVRIRPYGPADLTAVQRVAARSHTHNHFYNDPSLARAQAEAVFAEWIRRCAAGLAKFILVAETAEGVVGFVTALGNAALARAAGVSVGIIDYIVVDRAAAGKGLGRILLTAALRDLAREHAWAELRTSHHNYRALAFYQAAGFRIVSTDFVFHRWAEPGE